jgi:hypothetical protein
VKTINRDMKCRVTDRINNSINFVYFAVHAVHICGKVKVCTGFWLGGPKGRDNLDDQVVVGRITLR